MSKSKYQIKLKIQSPKPYTFGCFSNHPAAGGVKAKLSFGFDL